MVSSTKKTRTKKTLNKKTRTKKTSQIKKAECILGSIDKNGLIKPNNNNYNNDFNCLIAGHKPCLLDMNHFIKGLSKSIKNKLIQNKAKIYKNNVIYIYPRYKKHAILLYEKANNNVLIKKSLDLEDITELPKKFYILGVLLGYRNNEIRGFYLRHIAFDKVIIDDSKQSFVNIQNKIKAELQKINIPEFNKNYKKLKSVCDKWIKMSLGKDSIFNELYEKSDIDTSPLQI